MIRIAFIGVFLLLAWIIIDFIKNKTNNLWKRIIFYSFVFYLLVISQLTTGYMYIPPQAELARVDIQPIPFSFLIDWVHIYRMNGFDWFFWNSVKLSFFNLLMLIPLGIYLSLLFNITLVKKAAAIVFLTSLTIETYQLIFSFLGFFTRTFNVDDLILNTLGGVIGFVVWQVINKPFLHKKVVRSL